MNRQTRKILITLGVSSMLLWGCKKNPETDIVANKDFDNMVEQAENTEGQTTEVAELAENYDTYQTEILDETMHVEVNVDAKVDIPDTDQFSIYRVEQTEISQEFLDQVRDKLAGDVTFYEGYALEIETKESIEAEINAYRDMIKDIDEDISLSEEYKQSYRDEYQASIDELQARYESAPDTVSVTEFPSDNKLHSVSELYASDSTNKYYEWQYSITPNTEIYYGVNDAADGNYLSLYAQNNPDYGNCLRFRKTKIGYPFTSVVVVGDPACTYGRWDASGEPEEDDLAYANPEDIELKEDTRESVTLSEEEAREKADKLLTELGLTDYAYYEGGLCCDLLDVRYRADDSSHPYRKAYEFRYLRNVDGVFVNNDGGDKMVDEYQGDTYVKKLWGGESITVMVNDDGIVGFDLSTPIIVNEMVVERATLKSFEEIKDIFEQMVVTLNASGEERNKILDIDRVYLRYTRISEADSFDTGLLVPTWDFVGTVTDPYRGTEKNKVVLSINAIDGSVINRELGY